MDFLLRFIGDIIRAAVRLAVVIAVFIAVVIGIGMMVTNSKPPSATASSTSSAVAEKTPTVVPRWIHEDVIVTTKATRVGSLKSLIDFRFTVENKYDYPIKDVRIKCRWFGASGAEISNTDVVVYENFPARGKRTAAQLTLSAHSQSERYRCEAEAYRRS
jgi:hypothetical protein